MIWDSIRFARASGSPRWVVLDLVYDEDEFTHPARGRGWGIRRRWGDANLDDGREVAYWPSEGAAREEFGRQRDHHLKERWFSGVDRSGIRNRPTPEPWVGPGCLVQAEVRSSPRYQVHPLARVHSAIWIPAPIVGVREAVLVSREVGAGVARLDPVEAGDEVWLSESIFKSRCCGRTAVIAQRRRGEVTADYAHDAWSDLYARMPHLEPLRRGRHSKPIEMAGALIESRQIWGVWLDAGGRTAAFDPVPALDPEQIRDARARRAGTASLHGPEDLDHLAGLLRERLHSHEALSL